MGDHSRRPNRMARLRIVVYVVLVSSAHINISNSIMQEHRLNHRQGEWSKQSISHPKVHSKAAGSGPDVHSKVEGPHPNVHGKAGVTRPEVHSKVLVSQSEIHSKMGVSSLKIFENMLRLDGYSNQLEQTGNGLKVKDCPSDCQCVLVHKGNQTVLHVFNCESDPIDALPKLFDSHTNVTEVQLVNCHLTRLPPEIVKLPLVIVVLDMNEFTELPQVLLQLPQLVYLYMHNNKLSSIPANVTKCSKLGWLSLGHNMIAELPKEMGGMRNLQVLNLTHNALRSLPQSMGLLSQLNGLDVGYNKLQFLPQSSSAWSQLLYLDISHNKVQSLSQSSSAWSQLQYLDIGHNDFKTLPHSIGAWLQLQYLHASHNKLQTLPQSIRAWSQLQYMDISHNEVQSLPQSIGDLSQLQVLDIRYNKLQILPQSIAAWSQLQYLAVSNNDLQILPQTKGAWPQLLGLYISNNKLRTLPQSIGAWSQLQYLDISYNKLQTLPPSIGAWSQLQYLDISYNELETLPQSIGGWSELQHLDIGCNELKTLPQSIGRWLQLQWLDIGHNELKTLPQSIGAWSQLQTLGIVYNKLNSLPAEVGNLTQLELLWGSRNQLKTLPSEIGEMTTLIDLQLQDNEITVLPTEITKLKQLSGLDLSNNPLGEVPDLPMDGLMQFICNNCSIQTFPCELLTEGHILIVSLMYNGLKSAYCEKVDSYSLQQLRLGHNSLQEIPCEQFINNIQVFSVRYNNILTLPKTCNLLSGRSIEEIGFHFNKIDVLHFSSFCTEYSSRMLKNIEFGYNKITVIDTSNAPLDECFLPGSVIELQGNILSALDSWPMLLSQSKRIKLDVSDNKLSQFTSSAGRFLHGSQYGSVFIMRGNQIKHFMDVFNGWKVIVNTTGDLNTLLKNVYFDLGNNPLVCDCVDYGVYKYIQTLTTEQYNGLVCQAPLSLKNQNPYHIPLIHFVCAVDVDCPEGCTCTKVPHSQTINLLCLNYNQTDIPEIVPDLPKQNYQYLIDIRHQNLHEITFRPYLVKAAGIWLSNNSITTIKINSSNAFQRVKILNLDSNLLQKLPESVAGMTNGTAVEVRLGSNPWVCDCEIMSMKNWIMQNWHIVKDKNIIRCHSPPSMAGVKVIDIERSMACPKESKTVVYVVAVISSAVFISMVYLYFGDKLKYAKRRLVGSDECDGEFKEFDIFMCACSAIEDSEYVENFLIPELERRDFRVLYHREHFHPGKPIHVNMSEALEKSKRTLVFFSNSFRDSGYSMFEFHSAFDSDIQNRTRRLITIKDTNLDMKKLEVSEVHYFEKYTYLDREDVKFWKLLENALPRKRLGAPVRLDGH